MKITYNRCPSRLWLKRDFPLRLSLITLAVDYAIDVRTPLAYFCSMVFIETPIFSKQVIDILTDQEYGLLQASLVAKPNAGDLIKGSGGLRKLRWALPGRGKSGGVRVIYFWRVSESQILMLTMYAKNAQANLTPIQVKQLAKLVEALK